VKVRLVFIEVERTQSLEPCSKRGKSIPGSWKSYPGLLDPSSVDNCEGKDKGASMKVPVFMPSPRRAVSTAVEENHD
jgi:hypothetical protein